MNDPKQSLSQTLKDQSDGAIILALCLAARCELWGGARQHSRFNNCGEGGSVDHIRCPLRAREAVERR